ncbi:hypothetical protein P153DRAFT_358800 [Dothidotthia symphoricarpi CBS 119687]|uniref:Uncharacterized protein n=1 Tax=Dothidotthia symphoricarpi CBS 119687 TaxID=1392245 RepID=A0A6A6A7G1_9PLEO|nr:uncharacterized protein P153DRAFT_358800 [Dothidotthia symphoricarpi CBS 119687]KAF2127175.1 hypothetical protein P153DRAFT_358800 [Dothidotthia symphoricarpi CBS 119687]
MCTLADPQRREEKDDRLQAYSGIANKLCVAFVVLLNLAPRILLAWARENGVIDKVFDEGVDEVELCGLEVLVGHESKVQEGLTAPSRRIDCKTCGTNKKRSENNVPLPVRLLVTSTSSSTRHVSKSPFHSSKPVSVAKARSEQRSLDNMSISSLQVGLACAVDSEVLGLWSW